MHRVVSEFLFPNQAEHVVWTLMIVLYPYITGLVAGAFVVAALYHVFGKEEFKPVARFALVASFCFCAFATTPLLLHLHQPQRAFNIMFTPNFTSAMSGFGFIYSFYFVLLILEVLLVFRPAILKLAREERGVMALVYKGLALGVVHETPRSRALDHKIIGILSIIGIPAACILHGYVGFIFGSIKANPWWSTAVMPVVFLMSAIVSGIAMLIVLYVFMSKMRKVAVDDNCLRAMLKTLWLFLIVAFALEELDLLNKAYEAGETWQVLSVLISDHIHFSHTMVQTLFGAVLPLLLLPLAFSKKRPSRANWAVLTSSLVLIQVLAMRFNVVIGGQLFSKSYRGFTEYHVEYGGKEGLFAAIAVMIAPFILLYVVQRVLPIWKTDDDAPVVSA